mgnify:CR=1 FL=1
MKTQNYNPVYGSVLVGKVRIEGVGITYFPRYFDDGEKPPKLRRSKGERMVAVFKKVNAVNRGDDIGRLCGEASKTLERNPQISELALVRGLSKILTKRKCS